MDELAQVLRRGTDRIIAAFNKATDLHENPCEESMTALLLDETYPPVKYRSLNRWEESWLGGDWLWWIVAPDSRCFGMLTQAKVLKGPTGKRRIGFDQANKRVGRQDQAFIDTADKLKVPAVYVIYFGPAAYRPDLTRPALPGRPAPDDYAVTLLDGIRYKSTIQGTVDSTLFSKHKVVQETFEWSWPLVQLAEPGRQADWDLLDFRHPRYREVWRDLHEAAETTSAGRAAAALALSLARFREEQFKAIAPAPPDVEEDTDAVFPDLPDDPGHLNRPHIRYALQGYRRRPPQYVERFLDDREFPRSFLSSVNGLIVVDERRR